MEVIAEKPTLATGWWDVTTGERNDRLDVLNIFVSTFYLAPDRYCRAPSKASSPIRSLKSIYSFSFLFFSFFLITRTLVWIKGSGQKRKEWLWIEWLTKRNIRVYKEKEGERRNIGGGKEGRRSEGRDRERGIRQRKNKRKRFHG